MFRPTHVEYHRAISDLDDDDIGRAEASRAKPTDLRSILMDVGVGLAKPLNQPRLDPGHYPLLAKRPPKRSDSGDTLKGALKGTLQNIADNKERRPRLSDLTSCTSSMASFEDSSVADLHSCNHAPRHLPQEEEEEEEPVVHRRSSVKLTGSLRSSVELSVNFSTIEFRYYEVILGDSPSCRSGAPVGLGWRYDPSSTRRVSVLDYDSHMEVTGTRPSAKHCEELVLSERTREAMLLEAGYAKHELVDAIRLLKRANKWRRMRTHRTVYVGKLEKVAESCGRKLRETASLNKNAKNEQKQRGNECRSREIEEQRLSPLTGIYMMNRRAIGMRDVRLRQVCMQAKCA